MIGESGKLIGMHKDNLVAMIAASIRTGSCYSLLMEKIISENDAQKLAVDFIKDAIEIAKRDGEYHEISSD